MFIIRYLQSQAIKYYSSHCQLMHNTLITNISAVQIFGNAQYVIDDFLRLLAIF